MKRIIALTLLVFVAAMLIASSASAFDFDGIQFWVGSGSKQAGLVVDWNDGKSPESLGWGYRWNGTATGADMILAVVGADPRLDGVASVGSLGLFVESLDYDLNDNASSSDPADHTTGSEWWGYFTKDLATWSESGVGASGRTLQNNSWDGWSMTVSNAWPPSTPDDPVAAAVPEPGTLAGLLGGLATLSGLALRRRK